METSKLNEENLTKGSIWVVQSNPVVVEKMLIEKFQRLEDEMREHYRWCKIKLHAWGGVLLVLLLVLR